MSGNGNSRRRRNGDIAIARRASLLPTAIAGIIGLVTPYRDVIVLIGAVGGAAVGLHDYFATRTEVDVLRCRSDAYIAILDCHREQEQLLRSIEQYDRERGPNPGHDKIGPGADPAHDQPLSDTATQMRIQNLRNEHSQAQEKIAQARRRLQPDICEGLTKSKPSYAPIGLCSRQ
jgi:hypothetical protein